MPIPPPNGTYTQPKLGIGNSASFLQSTYFVGDNFEADAVWLLPDPLDCNAPKVLANFTDYVPVAEIIDALGNVVETVTVSPLVGDTTGTFLFSLTTGQATTALANAGKQWRFRITLVSPSFQQTLFVAPFELRTV